jgi:hypothetical protein
VALQLCGERGARLRLARRRAVQAGRRARVPRVSIVCVRRCSYARTARAALRQMAPRRRARARMIVARTRTRRQRASSPRPWRSAAVKTRVRASPSGSLRAEPLRAAACATRQPASSRLRARQPCARATRTPRHTHADGSGR